MQPLAVFNQNRIHGFDGLRGLAVLLVLFNHKGPIPDALASFAVWAFIALSGFLIIGGLADERAKMERGEADLTASLLTFWRRRASRILPLFYLVLAVFSLAALMGARGFANAFEAVAFWLHGANFIVGERGWGFPLDSYWSLAVEEQFYLIAAPFILLVPRRWTLRACFLIFIAGLLVSFTLGIGGAKPTQIYVHSLVNFALFAVGGAAGLLARRALPHWLVCAWAQMIVVLGICLACAALLGMGGAARLMGPLAAILAATLLLQMRQAQGTWLVKFFELAPLRPLGRISYGIYLIHPLVLLSALGLSSPTTRAIEIGVSIALAALSWRYFEQPIMRWARRREAKPAAGIRPSLSAKGAGFARPARSFAAGDRRAFPACGS